MPVIEIKNAAFDYGDRNIFHDINLAIGKGEVFCLLGPNGSGKTTFLDCVLGANRLKSGNIAVEGTDISSMGPRKLARLISCVPQRHESTFPYSVMDITLMGRVAYTGMFSAPSSNDREIAAEALKLTGVYHLKERPYTLLSGGELQLVMIARALAQDTGIIVMDEPTAHLDFRHELVVLEAIAGLVDKKGISVLMATHFPNHAFYFEDSGIKIKTALLKNGKFIAEGTPGDILDERRIEDLYGVKSGIFSYRENGGKERKRIIPVKTVKQ